MTTYDEHLAWCKQRALQYLDAHDVKNAICSMMSDLNKHEETKRQNQYIMALGIIIATDDDELEARRWIEGFR